MSGARRRAGTRVLVGCVALAAAGVWLFGSQATTRQGVDFTVSTLRIPLYVKCLDFFQRDAHYRLHASRITDRLRTDQERVQAVFDWTRRNIRKTPRGWPVVDDHVLNIIIRGHGLDDQMADVFTTLATYAGVPAFWRWVEAPGTEQMVVLSFARLEDRWAVFDVWRGLRLSDDEGLLLSAEQLAAEPALAGEAIDELRVGATPYARYLANLGRVTVQEPLRAELQMPWPRLLNEVRQAFRLAPEERESVVSRSPGRMAAVR